MTYRSVNISSGLCPPIYISHLRFVLTMIRWNFQEMTKNIFYIFLANMSVALKQIYINKKGSCFRKTASLIKGFGIQLPDDFKNFT